MVVYNSELESVKKDPKPQPIDKLTEVFNRGSTAALKKFDKEVIDPTAHPKYETRLQNLIDNEEAALLRENQKKTILYYHDALPASDPANSRTYVSKLKDTFEKDKEEKLR